MARKLPRQQKGTKKCEYANKCLRNTHQLLKNGKTNEVIEIWGKWQCILYSNRIIGKMSPE